MGDVADLTAKAYEIVRMIPPGHVTTYGRLRSRPFPLFPLAALNRTPRAHCETRRVPELLQVGGTQASQGDADRKQTCRERHENVAERQRHPLAGKFYRRRNSAEVLSG